MSGQPQATFNLFPWRACLPANTPGQAPDGATEQRLKKNRWWWQWVDQAIARYVEAEFPSSRGKEAKARARESLTRTWWIVEQSAFLYELDRRCENHDLPSWVELNDAGIFSVLKKWPSQHNTAGLDSPLVLQPFKAGLEWQHEPVTVIREPRTGEALWNKCEPAWTAPVVTAVNLSTGDKAISAWFMSWVADERERTGIPSPRGGATKRLGKRLWRLIEILDKKAVGGGLDEIQNSSCSKARRLWKDTKEVPPPYTPQFYLKVALRDIPKHGKILAKSLPKIRQSDAKKK